MEPLTAVLVFVCAVTLIYGMAFVVSFWYHHAHYYNAKCCKNVAEKNHADLTRKYNLLQELVMRYRVEATRGKAKNPLHDAEVPLEWRVGALESKSLLQGMMQESHERPEPAVCEKCGLPVVMEELFAFEYDGGVLAVCDACLQVLKERKGESDAESQS